MLALQGDVLEHRRALERCGAQSLEVRTTQDLHQAEALIIPGGESTTIGKLMDRYGLIEAVHQRVSEGMSVFGTCAGLILMAKAVRKSTTPRLSVMDLTVERNAYGSQTESFEADVSVPALGNPPVRGVFIRAPAVTAVGEGVEVLAMHEDSPVLVQQGRLLAASFHPELTEDLRIHQHFLSLVE